MNISGRLLFAAVFAASVTISPSFAYGGIFSFFTKSKINPSQAKAVQTLDSISLLESTMSPDKNPARGGAEIVLEDNSALVASTAGEYVENSVIAKAQTGHISVYEVREGDSLSQIANMFSVSTNTIRWANDIDGGITPGQTLVILPVTGVKHIVTKNDTVDSLAKKYNAHAEEIADFNAIFGGKLVIGEEVIIPDAEPTAKSPSAVKSPTEKSSGVSTSGYFIWPVGGGVKTQGIHGYNAVDIGAKTGTPIYAAATGTVMVARSGGWNGGYGNYVVIKHKNGTQTLYAHASSLAVISGELVSQGEVIGYVGSTGKSTGSHLHFEVRGGTNPF